MNVNNTMSNLADHRFPEIFIGPFSFSHLLCRSQKSPAEKILMRKL
jgi:hypothetical protein